MRRSGFRRGYPDAVGRLVKDSLERLGLRGRVLEHQVVHQWSSIVGSQIAKCTVAREVRGGILFVCCKSSMWCNELSLHKTKIMSQLNSAVGKKVLTDIHFSARGFRQAQAEQASPGSSTGTEGVRLPQTELDAAERIASSAGSQELAARVRRAVLTSKRREALKAADEGVKCPICSRAHGSSESCPPEEQSQ